jgi:hypothetical protein
MEGDARKLAKRRRFLRETGSIVFGVLIALSLGAIAAEIGWLLDVRSAKSAISEELGEILGQARERERIYPCVDRKLATISAILVEAEKTGQLPPVGPIGDPAWRTWSHNVWDSTINSDTAGHFDRDTLDNISGVYEFVTIINRYSEQEVDAWRRLYAIVGPGGPIEDREVVGLRDALSSARLANRMMTGSSLRMAQMARAFDLPVDWDTVAEYGDAPIDRYCAPIGKAAGGAYGEAPMPEMVDRIRKNPITKERIGTSK